ncbi:CocE/NonD family hydrolase [Nocardioides sp. Kera G14]|uniref:CocE/NonD family hydrolase n=1 Tax=Nocardioides sp. Kera G14 TaxID=2884264 RepID=UPI001D106AD4|nr:CocE/NonD family hydrolase [Nocardioides sp. Kera G14]UDY22873.1 CocE/NonD family hydrolase [Nocardioides sp. Kera G14]
MSPRLRRGAIPATLALLAGLLVTSISVEAAHADSSFSARGSVEQVYVTGLAPGATVTLLDSASHVVKTRAANQLGGALFRDVAAGSGYRVTSGGTTSAALTVDSDPIASTLAPSQIDAAPADTSIYDQTINSDGYQYLTTRDGTQLALTVHPPNQPAGILDLPGSTGLPVLPADLPVSWVPPYPTLIEYSGYGTAAPDAPVNGIAAVANAMGFAVVDVSMRGTGCSGGAYDFFEPLQSLDGYDVIETIARQPWVRGHKVGMLGISYGGISQLFTAQTRPPSLAAISPLSTIDSVPTTLYPGGIRNDGFAVWWANERQEEAQPAGQGLEGTQPYAEEQIASGDQTCLANQALHPEANDLMAKIDANSTYKPETADPLDPVSFVDRIDVPVFMACQWQDEQTGGHCPSLAARMTGTDKKWFTYTNGAHIDSLDPATLTRLYDFLMIYVARQAPVVNATVLQALAPMIYQTALGVQSDVMTLPPDPIQLQPTLAGAQSAFEALPSVRVLFDNGAGSPLVPLAAKGTPYAGFETSFASFPVPGTTARSWYLGPNDALLDNPTSTAGANRYTSDPKAVPGVDFTGNTGSGGLWGDRTQWSWNWKAHPQGNAVSYVSQPLSQDTVVVGAGAVEVWAKSSTPDVDFQATVSEINADGNETFVQNGWMRGSLRALSTDADNVFKTPSTVLNPIPSLREADARPMPSDSYTKVTIPLYYEGHPYRAGTRIKVTISAPNGSQPTWEFDHTEPSTGTSDVTVAFSPDMPSRLVLPVVPGVAVPTGQPECGILRNEPCRTYAHVANAVATVGDVPAGDDSGSSTGGTGTTGGTGNTGNAGGAGHVGAQSSSKATCRGLRATIVGTSGADVLVGTSRRDVIVGGAGNDVIRGRGGNDVICGGRGKDRISGGRGRDRLYGGPGRDRIRQA